MSTVSPEMNQKWLVDKDNKIVCSPSSLLNYSELFFKFLLDIDRYSREECPKPFQFDQHHAACLTDGYRVPSTSLQVNLLMCARACVQGGVCVCVYVHVCDRKKEGYNGSSPQVQCNSTEGEMPSITGSHCC